MKIGEGLIEVHHNSSERPADIHKQLVEAIVISENGDETVQSLTDIITVNCNSSCLEGKCALLFNVL